MTVATATHSPERSAQQRLDALERANVIRSLRAQLKRDLKAGHVDVVAIIVDPPEWAESMKLVTLAMAIPKVGRTKVNNVLRATRVSPSKTLGGLSQRQRGEVIGALRRYRPATSPVPGHA